MYLKYLNKCFIWYTGWARSYRKSVLYFCLSVLGRLRDLQYIFAVTFGAPSRFYLIFSFVGDCIRQTNQINAQPSYNRPGNIFLFLYSGFLLSILKFSHLPIMNSEHINISNRVPISTYASLFLILKKHNRKI